MLCLLLLHLSVPDNDVTLSTYIIRPVTYKKSHQIFANIPAGRHFDKTSGFLQQHRGV